MDKSVAKKSLGTSASKKNTKQPAEEKVQTQVA
jgi:hypothetical protein